MYIHSTSQTLLQQISADLPQSLLLSGPDGIGFAGALNILSNGDQYTLIQPEKDEQINLEKGSISVEMIRDLYQSVRGRSSTRQLIVIRDADRMSHGAQNAFLKLLEEPNAHTHFVLLAHHPDHLLPTIRSRMQQIDLRPITTEQSNELLDSLRITDPTTRTQLLFIADGLPALLTRLATNPDAFQARAQIVRDARTLLTDKPYKKLQIIDHYREKREDVLIMLTDAANLLKRSPDATSVAKITAILTIYDRVHQNGNIRLQLATLVV